MRTSLKINIAKYISSILIFFLRKRNVCIKRNDLIWNLDLNEAIDLSIYLIGRFEPSIFFTIKSLTENDRYDYIDIGANNGVHSLYLAKEFINSKIYAVEPTNYSFSKLLKNIDLNPNIKNQIIPIQGFVTSKKSKPDTVYTSWELNSKDKKHLKHLGVKKPLENCKIIKLDELVEKNNIQKAIIKCDVDGNELFVFESGLNFLDKFKPKIVMELAPYLYPENGYKSSDLFNFFKQFDYKYFDVTSKKEIHNIQDFSDAIVTGSSKNIFLV